MRCGGGVIPIITKESGVDFSPLGYLEPKLNSANNFEILKKVFNLSIEEKKLLSLKTAEYYNNNHTNFKDKLRIIFKEIIDKEQIL